ncbi:GerAB/ArcD/ProY family transporter [Chengkuizengella sediminis]|uniref:GerAB/ArcD/ProY family transporter n=1 Tax=Chengkuizengella sediminis TaxID=1885917 RepID=UPI00138A5BF8|nr:endospore germination permease [Chengkuizengella sediminis]NDI33191.1 endospore germination permease [Chengkuizengella sediminis]
MLEQGKISNRQLTILIVQFIIGSKILFVPASLAADSEQDVWISGLIAIVVGVLVAWFYAHLALQFKNQGILQYSEAVLGKWLGKLVTIVLCLYFLIIAAFLVRDIADFMTIQIIPGTPILAIMIVFMIVTIIGVRLGLEVLSRAAEIFNPWVILLLLLLLVSVSTQIEWKNILPVFDHQMKHIMKSSLTFITFPYLEMIIFLQILPYVNKPSLVKRSMIVGTILGGGMLVVVTLFCVLILGVDSTTRHIYPTYALAKKITIGEFISRIEVIVAGVWFLTIFIKLSLCLYFIAASIMQLFALKNYKPLTLPIGIILICLAILLVPNMTYLITFDATTWIPIAIIVGFILPLIIYIVHKLKLATSGKKT